MYLNLTPDALEYPIGLRSRVIYAGHTAESLHRRPGLLSANAMARAVRGDKTVYDRFQWSARRGWMAVAYTTLPAGSGCTTAALEAAVLLAFDELYLSTPRFDHAMTFNTT